MASRDPQAKMSQIQRQIQQDWANREYIEVITCSIKKITDFLNSFGRDYFQNIETLDQFTVLFSHSLQYFLDLVERVAGGGGWVVRGLVGVHPGGGGGTPIIYWWGCAIAHQ